MIKLYNSLTRKVEDFVPIDDRHIRIYSCGPTVYSDPHIGNLRSVLFADILRQTVAYRYGTDATDAVMNITDVDDKIIEATKGGGDRSRFTEDIINRFGHDLGTITNYWSDVYHPKATRHIDEMIEMIITLINKGHAYIVEGEVFFDVASNPYQTMSGHAAEHLQHGEHRVEIDPRKKDPRDFVLWKPSKPNEPAWESPWGQGRPGWHIECSAMIKATLGQTIDIHTGGEDLRFPHHEAEMSQSACAHDGAPLANYWMHNGMLTVDGKKMSKSLGNVVSVRELLNFYPGESIRYFMFLTHYRSPLNYSKTSMNKAHRALDGLYRTLDEYSHLEKTYQYVAPTKIQEKLEQDLNTPGAIAALHFLERMLRERDDKQERYNEFVTAGRLLGFFNSSTSKWTKSGVDSKVIDAMLEERDAARASKDWVKADEIRDNLSRMGITIADGVHGTSWRRTGGI